LLIKRWISAAMPLVGRLLNPTVQVEAGTIGRIFHSHGGLTPAAGIGASSVKRNGSQNLTPPDGHGRNPLLPVYTGNP